MITAKQWPAQIVALRDIYLCPSIRIIRPMNGSMDLIDKRNKIQQIRQKFGNVLVRSALLFFRDLEFVRETFP